MIEMLQRNLVDVSADAETKKEAAQELDPRILSSVLVSVKLMPSQEEPVADGDAHTKLLELMHASPVKALLDAAQLLSQREGLAPHEALQQIVISLKEIDVLWTRVLLKEGLARLGSQYH